jgi:hypothetical protein
LICLIPGVKTGNKSAQEVCIGKCKTGGERMKEKFGKGFPVNVSSCYN